MPEQRLDALMVNIHGLTINQQGMQTPFWQNVLFESNIGHLHDLYKSKDFVV